MEYGEEEVGVEGWPHPDEDGSADEGACGAEAPDGCPQPEGAGAPDEGGGAAGFSGLED